MYLQFIFMFFSNDISRSHEVAKSHEVTKSRSREVTRSHEMDINPSRLFYYPTFAFILING